MISLMSKCLEDSLLAHHILENVNESYYNPRDVLNRRWFNYCGRAIIINLLIIKNDAKFEEDNEWCCC